MDFLLKRNVEVFSSACVNGVNAMNDNRDYQAAERNRFCTEPTEIATGIYEITCPANEDYATACDRAGGDVCTFEARYMGTYGEAGNQRATYEWEGGLCIPRDCQNDENLAALQNRFSTVICTMFGLEACSINFDCASATTKNSSKAAVIAVSILLAFLVLGLVTVGGFFLWRRYQAGSAATATTQVADANFHEYAELAQYEEEDNDIIADTGLDAGDAEESHSLN